MQVFLPWTSRAPALGVLKPLLRTALWCQRNPQSSRNWQTSHAGALYLAVIALKLLFPTVSSLLVYVLRCRSHGAKKGILSALARNRSLSPMKDKLRVPEEIARTSSDTSVVLLRHPCQVHPRAYRAAYHVHDAAPSMSCPVLDPRYRRRRY